MSSVKHDMPGAMLPGFRNADSCTWPRYAALGYNPGMMLLVAMAKEVQRHLQDYGLQELADLLWAIAQLGGVPSAEVDQLLGLMPDALYLQLQQTKASQVCNFPCVKGHVGVCDSQAMRGTPLLDGPF